MAVGQQNPVPDDDKRQYRRELSRRGPSGPPHKRFVSNENAARHPVLSAYCQLIDKLAQFGRLCK